jgi:hypothetical protein
MSKRTRVRCKRFAAPGRATCNLHGGKSLKGVNATSFKHGRFSKYLPDRLVERYREALADEELLRLDDEIALLDTRLQDLLARLHQDGEGPGAWHQIHDAHQRLEQAIARDDANATQAGLVMLSNAIASGRDESSAWRMILQLIEQRRKLVDTERRRLLDEDQVITVERLMIFVAALTDIIRRNVASREERAAVSNEIRCLVSGN